MLREDFHILLGSSLCPKVHPDLSAASRVQSTAPRPHEEGLRLLQVFLVNERWGHRSSLLRQLGGKRAKRCSKAPKLLRRLFEVL